MIKKLTVISLLLSNISFAQNLPKPTQFDKFINKPSIEWAGYANDSIRFEKEHLNNILLNRLTKKEIKATLYMWGGSDEANYIRYITKDSIDNIVLYPFNTFPILDSNGNAIPVKWEEQKRKIDTASFTMTDITQVLYIENGKLKSYVPWVSPMIPIITSYGAFLGDGGYFSTCFNFKYNYEPSQKTKILFLSQTRQKIRLDTTGSGNRLKELYGRNLIETLWPYILENKIEVLSTETNTKLKKEDIYPNLLKIPSPRYDSLGIPDTYWTQNIDINPAWFSEIQLVQDWYYSYTENIVFNKIKELYVYVKCPSKYLKYPSMEEGEVSLPVLKIVFN